MTNAGRAARAKGIRFERAIAKWFGTVTTRSTRPGIADDAADIWLPGYMIECKDHARWTVNQWFTELEGKTRDEETPVLILKRRNQPTSEALVVQRLADFWEPSEQADNG
jgi:hypothetical protein